MIAGAEICVIEEHGLGKRVSGVEALVWRLAPTSLMASWALRCSSGSPFSSLIRETGIKVLNPSVALMLYMRSRNCRLLT